jgi:phosphate transport system permease protein
MNGRAADSRYRRRTARSSLFDAAVWACGLLGLILPFWIVTYLMANGAGVLSVRFLTDRPRGFPLGTAGGILPAVEGSAALVGIGLLVAFPAGVGAALYLAEFCRYPRFRSFSRLVIESLAAVPSILYGLFGYAFFVVLLRFGISLAAGGLVLAIVMFPIILITAQEAFQAVGHEYREAALSLGVDRTAWVTGVLFRKAWSRVLAGVVLAVGHAVGSASPVLFTASVYFTAGGLRLDHPVMTLPTHLYFLVAEAVSFEHAYGTALVLVLGLFAFNASAMLLRSRARNL